MNKEEKELGKYVDEYFDKYMCVSFDKFLENWEETNGLLKYFESKQNELQHRIDKAIDHLEESIEILKDSKPNDDVPVSWYDVKKRYLEPPLDILRGEDNDKA